MNQCSLTLMMKLLIGSIKTQEITPMVVLELMSLGAKLFLLVHQDLSNVILTRTEAIHNGFFFIKRKDHLSGQFLINQKELFFFG